MQATMLTTEDNPFDPFTEFEKWNQFDTSKGYYTCAYLARIIDITKDEDEEAAIESILKHNVLGIYKAVNST